MAATAPIPTLPGVTEEQVLQAMEIVEAVCLESGVRVRVEAELSRDPEIAASAFIKVRAWAESAPGKGWPHLATAIATALEEAGLSEPALPIQPHLAPAW